MKEEKIMSRYSVYRNLNNGKLSVRDNKGLVVGHCDAITLFGVRFNVNKKGLKRIRETKRKEVVAVANGQVLSAYNFTTYKNRESLDTFKLHDYRPVYEHRNFVVNQIAKKITFNPYTHDKFRAWTSLDNNAASWEVDDAYLVAIDKDGRMLGLT
jgi:hypothetical protein